MFKRIFLAFQLLLISASVSSDTKTYEYNQRDQVVSITSDTDPNNPITFTYDEAGNRTSKSHNGVLTEYKWSPRHRLAEVSRNSMWLTRYRYDYRGLMVVKQIRSVGKSTQQINYHYDDNRLIAETNVIGNVLVKYEWAKGQLIGETRERNTYYYQKDAMGSIVAITAQDGTMVARFEYDAFGNIIATQGSHKGLFGYTGFYADDETGLYYAQQRFYDAELGAFISEDPLDGTSNDPQSQHRYNYAKANPNKYVDRDGRCSTTANMFFPSDCERFKEGLTNPKALEESIREIKLEGAAAVGVAQAVGNIVTGAVQTVKDIGGTYVEAATGGKLAKGSMLRLRGQVDAQIDFIKHPIDTVEKAIGNHQQIVKAMEEAGDYEGATRERARFASTGLLAVVGLGKVGQVSFNKASSFLKNRTLNNKALNTQSPQPIIPESRVKFGDNDFTGIITEGGGNKIELTSFNQPVVAKQVKVTRQQIQDKTNYRKRFLKSRPDLPDGFQVHHSIPQKYQDLFDLAEVNIQETQFLRGVNTDIHSNITTEWLRFDKKNGGDPTAAQIADFAKYIDGKYNSDFVWPGF